MIRAHIRKVVIYSLTCLAFGLGPVGAARGTGGGCASEPGVAPGRVLVGLNTVAPMDLPREVAALEDGQPDMLVDIPRMAVVALPVTPGQECAALQALSRDPGVIFAERDFLAQASELESPTFSGITPSDPLWGQQWSLRTLHLPEAWSLETGAGGVLVAVVDSGVQVNHPDLQAQLWTNPGEVPANGLDDDGNGKIDDLHGWHFYQAWDGAGYRPAENAQVGDDLGHGTHVSGILAAVTDNGVGVAGVAWGARLLPVKVLDRYGTGWYSDIAKGIIYAADQGARIINLSLGGKEASQTLAAAIDYARARGALVVAATGNGGEAVFYPAAYAPVIAVGASDDQDGWAAFSNFGPQVDLVAPGINIQSTWNYGNYLVKSGTSMAAPQVSGVAALLWSHAPGLGLAEVEAILLDSRRDIDAPGVDIHTGQGRIDALRALAHLEPVPDLWLSAQSPVKAWPGQTVTYTLVIGNSGDAPAKGVAVSSPAVPGEQGAGMWALPSLPAHSPPLTLTLAVTLTAIQGEVARVSSIATQDLEAGLEDNQARTVIRVLPYRLYFPQAGKAQ